MRNTSNCQATFKKPTIKGTSRAYVRLFSYFQTPEKWLEFLEQFRIEYVAFGMQRAGDCAVRVIEPSNGKVADLGLDVPNEIKYHTYVATARSFWIEEFSSSTYRRHRMTEVGARPHTDDISSR